MEVSQMTLFTTTYGREPLMVSHHAAKFNGHRYCGSGDIMVLDCPVIPKDHVSKGSCDFMGETSSW